MKWKYNKDPRSRQVELGEVEGFRAALIVRRRTTANTEPDYLIVE